MQEQGPWWSGERASLSKGNKSQVPERTSWQSCNSCYICYKTAFAQMLNCQKQTEKCFTNHQTKLLGARKQFFYTVFVSNSPNPKIFEWSQSTAQVPEVGTVSDKRYQFSNQLRNFYTKSVWRLSKNAYPELSCGQTERKDMLMWQQV